MGVSIDLFGSFVMLICVRRNSNVFAEFETSIIFSTDITQQTDGHANRFRTWVWPRIHTFYVVFGAWCFSMSQKILTKEVYAHSLVVGRKRSYAMFGWNETYWYLTLAFFLFLFPAFIEYIYKQTGRNVLRNIR